VAPGTPDVGFLGKKEPKNRPPLNPEPRTGVGSHHVAPGIPDVGFLRKRAQEPHPAWLGVTDRRREPSRGSGHPGRGFSGEERAQEPTSAQPRATDRRREPSRGPKHPGSGLFWGKNTEDHPSTRPRATDRRREPSCDSGHPGRYDRGIKKAHTFRVLDSLRRVEKVEGEGGEMRAPPPPDGTLTRSGLASSAGRGL
jgi:hypothetical protein